MPSVFQIQSGTPSSALSSEETAGLRVAEEDIRAGRVLSFDEVKRWVESWDSPEELPAPHDRWR